MDNKIIVGIIGVIGMLLGWGGSVVLNQSTISNSYICNINENLGVFEGGLSDSGKSGYYTNELGEKKYNTCKNGQWIPLLDYAKQKGVSPETFTEKVIVNTIVEEKLVRPECSGVAIVVKDGKNTYYCNGLGPNVNCVNADDIELPLYKT